LKIFTLTIIGIVAFFAFIIYRKHNEEKRLHQQIEYDLINKAGWENISSEINKRGIPQFHDLADPELEEAWMKLPYKRFLYFPDNMTQEELNLIEGTGTLPLYPEGEDYRYGNIYVAPRAVSQLAHDVPKPSGYAYVPWKYTAKV
jgi:hypothetical protein